ncbi:MAG: hypothetical protein J6Z12_03505 [Paludibacteraceae bacterium]|nr:hypothetical protein [Paludibacteraceae bacterium]
MFGLSKISWEKFVCVVSVLLVLFNLAVWFYYARMSKGGRPSLEETRMQRFADEQEEERS